MASDVQKNFIQEIGSYIRREALARGYLVCSPIVAQATVESFKGQGLSQLATKYHNYFGMKAGKSWKGKSICLRTGEEYSTGKITFINDSFRVYDNMEEGVKGYFVFISSARYANLKDARTPLEYLERIKADGYATSSTYVKNNMNRIALYGLQIYDEDLDGGVVINGNPYAIPTKTLKMGSKGNSVRWLQYELNRHGYGLIVDGIFGQKTEDAVRDYQNRHALVCDGLVGAKTRAELLSDN